MYANKAVGRDEGDEKVTCFYRSTTLYVDEVNQKTVYATDDLWLF